MRDAFPQCSQTSLTAQKGDPHHVPLLELGDLQLRHTSPCYALACSVNVKRTGSTCAGLKRYTGHHGMTGLMPLEQEAPWMMAMLDQP